jgi:hypothetical protein
VAEGYKAQIDELEQRAAVQAAEVSAEAGADSALSRGLCFPSPQASLLADALTAQIEDLQAQLDNAHEQLEQIEDLRERETAATEQAGDAALASSASPVLDQGEGGTLGDELGVEGKESKYE